MDAARAVAVTNTSPIIALASIGCAPILSSLFVEIVVPFEVWGELNDRLNAREPQVLLAMQSVRFLPAPTAAMNPDLLVLHTGERDAISIALTMPGARVLLDEAKARKIAAGLGLRVVGTLGLLVEGKRRGLVPEVRSLIDALRTRGFRVGDAVLEAALRAAGE